MNRNAATHVQNLLTLLLGGGKGQRQAFSEHEMAAMKVSARVLAQMSREWIPDAEVWGPNDVEGAWSRLEENRQAMETAADLLVRSVQATVPCLDAAEELRRILCLPSLEEEPEDCQTLVTIVKGAAGQLVQVEGVLHLPRVWGQSTHEADAVDIEPGQVFKCSLGRFHEGDHILEPFPPTTTSSSRERA